MQVIVRRDFACLTALVLSFSFAGMPVSSLEDSAIKTQKNRRNENFPVGSFFIPSRLRPDVHAYYKFARFADDIADNPDLSLDNKIAQLDAMESAVQGQDGAGVNPEIAQAAQDIGDRLRTRGLGTEVATDLLVAFRMDGENQTCHTWGDLIDYCRFSACPVGRFLLFLHDEGNCQTESDALCCALQILNHLQDAGADYLTLQRVYIPLDWLDHDGGTQEDLAKGKMGVELRNTFDRALEQTNLLLSRAERLPYLVRHRGLAAEAAICLSLAKRLSRRLHLSDPLSLKVGLTKADWLLAGLMGLLRYIRP